MTGATIDHMVSVTILIAALLIAMMTYSNMFAAAIDYDLNRQVATKAVDIMNTICLSPGNPPDWGSTNKSVLGFGLQDPFVGGFTLSPYSVMRLKTSTDDQLIGYDKTPGIFYNNLSASFGNGVFNSVGNCVNYTEISRLLGVEGEYGFSIDITPTLDVTVVPVDGDHLILRVDVKGSGIPLANADLNCFLFHVGSASQYPIINAYSGVEQSNGYGYAVIDFPSITHPEDAYTFVVYASFSGLTGIGYYSQDDVGDMPEFLIPLIQDYENGKVIIAHNWDVHYFGHPEPNVFYNSTFFALTSDFQLQEIKIDNSTGQLNYGEGKPYHTTQLPTSQVGLLFISYRWNQKLGCVILPWGIGALGVPVSFGNDIGSAGYSFVATELRQVVIDGIAYQVKVSTWKLKN